MKKYLNYILSAVLLVLIFIAVFLVDMRINSKIFIRRHFNQAFKYRITGDCDSFAKYLYSDIEKWRNTCEDEKERENIPITEFLIQNISYKIGSNEAFLQVKLTRDNIDGKDMSYSVNYEMIRDGLGWKINQEKK